MITKIPFPIKEILGKLERTGFEAYIVGGCVRDLIMDREPKDWDIATNAKPEEIVAIFPDSFYENDFGTVGVKIEPLNGLAEIRKNKKYDIVEITTYRIESTYTDRRRPDEVKFAQTLQEDVGRRDFTMNAIAIKLKGEDDLVIEDFFAGRKDIENKIIRSVGDAHTRFNEDALRMLRAVRFHAQLGFEIETKTLDAINEMSNFIEHVASERIKDELVKIILSDNPAEGVDTLRKTGLLGRIIPELGAGVGIMQNRHHIYDIYSHLLLSLKHCPSRKLEVRLAALFHDIAKPQTKRGEGEFSTFYNHDHVGARMVEKILKRLKFSVEVIKKTVLLVDNHMFYYNPDEVTESSVRKLIRKAGLENMQDLIDVRIADRLGSGTPKAKPYKLRHLEYIIEKVSHDPVSVKMLKVNGNDLMKECAIAPGPKLGAILDVLLAEAIEDPTKNNREYLLDRSMELEKENLSFLRDAAKEKIDEKKEEDDKRMQHRHWVG